MDMSVINFSPAFRAITRSEPVDGTLASNVTEVALELANLEVAVSDLLNSRLLVLDCYGRADLAKVRDAISHLAVKTRAAAKSQ